MHFIKGELLLFDCESDGKDPEEARLIEAALIHVNPGKPRREKIWLAQPTRPIPQEATGVHGISTEHAEVNGKPLSDVLQEIVSTFSAWNKTNAVIAHNACFDLTLLDRNLHRELGIDLEIRGPVIDTLLLDKCCDQWRPGSRQLVDTVKHYRLNLVNAHSAAADALAAGQVAWRMATMRNWPYGRYGPSALEREARLMVAAGDAASLHRAQQRWYRTTQLELAAYFRTSRAVESIERKVADCRMTREQADAAILELPAAADRAEASAESGWPLRPRVPVTT
jgi:DNA polymerase-3 subunit epsilon